MLRRGTGRTGVVVGWLVDVKRLVVSVVAFGRVVARHLLPPSARRQEGRRSRRKSEMLEDPLDGRGAGDERNHEHGRRAPGAREGVQIEDSSQKLGPGHAALARWRFLFGRDLLVGVAIRRGQQTAILEAVGEDAVVANEVRVGTRYEGGKAAKQC